MSFGHNSAETVRRYLLGTLEDREADLLEDRYFTDAACYRQVRRIEESLIADYLNGRLSEGDRELFDARYRKVPELRQRLEEVSAQLYRPRAGLRRGILTAGVCIALCLLSITLIVRTRQPAVAPEGHRPPLPAALIVHLTPGITKSAGGGVSFPASPGSRINLLFEIPGLRTPISCVADIASLDAEGHRMPVWKSISAMSVPTVSGQRVSVEFDAAILKPDYYLGRIVDASGETLGTYPFTVRAAP
jgi:hypothetical protein